MDRRRSFSQVPSHCYICKFQILLQAILEGLEVILECSRQMHIYRTSAKLIPTDILSNTIQRLGSETNQAVTMSLIVNRCTEGDSIDLPFLLNNLSRSEYFDDKDSFYAVHSLVFPNNPTASIPDYRADATTVVQAHMMHILESGHGITII